MSSIPSIYSVELRYQVIYKNNHGSGIVLNSSYENSQKGKESATLRARELQKFNDAEQTEQENPKAKNRKKK